MAGACGAVGRALVRHLEALGEWDVVGIGRRGPSVRYTRRVRARFPKDEQEQKEDAAPDG